MIPVFKVSLNLSSVDKKIRKIIRTFPQKTTQALYTSAISVLVPPAKQRIKDNKSIYLGKLYEQLGVRASKRKDRVLIEFGSIGVPYGANVERGASPHVPDYDRIIDYVHKKMGLSGEKGKILALKIIKTIETFGTKPHSYLIPTWEATKDAFWKDFFARVEILS